MPELWFKHENPDILPYSIPYDDDAQVDRIVAGQIGNGWSRFEPDDDELAALRDLSQPHVPADQPPVDLQADPQSYVPVPHPSPGEPDDTEPDDRPDPSTKE